MQDNGAEWEALSILSRPKIQVFICTNFDVQHNSTADTKILIFSLPNRNLRTLNIFKQLDPAHEPISVSRTRRER